MQINPISPSFKGFVRFHDSKTDKYTAPVNTSNILGFESMACKEQNMYCNAVSYINSENKLTKISNVHVLSGEQADEELPAGKDFNSAFAAACAEADKTGEIFNILI